MTKKIRIIIPICLIGLIILALFPKGVSHISNAVVNENNGDVAICYDISDSNSAQVVELFDKDGKKLFSKALITSKMCDLVFDGDILCIATNDLNSIVYAFERNGNKASTELTAEQICSMYSFDNWKYGLFKATYYWDEYQYCYKKPHFFRHKSTFLIIKGDNSTVIFQDPKS